MTISTYMQAIFIWRVARISYACIYIGYTWGNAENTLKIRSILNSNARYTSYTSNTFKYVNTHWACQTYVARYLFVFHTDVFFGISDLIPEFMRNVKLHTSSLCQTYFQHMYSISQRISGMFPYAKYFEHSQTNKILTTCWAPYENAPQHTHIKYDVCLAHL